MAKTVNVTWTETRTYSDVVIPMDRLIQLMWEHVPDALAEKIGEMLDDDAPGDPDTYGPLLQAIREEVGAEGSWDDVTDVSHDIADES